MGHTDRPGESELANITLELKVLPSRETDQAIYVNHPKNTLKFFYLPKSEISKNVASPKGKLWCDVTMPEWLAEEHNLG